MSDAVWTPRFALSDGLRAAGLWYGGTALALALASAALVVGDLRAVAVLAVPVAVIAAGGLLLVLPLPRPVAVAAATVVMTAGATAALVVLARSAAPPASTAAFPLPPLKIAMLAFGVNAGRRRAPLIAGVAITAVTETAAGLVGPALGVPWAFDLPATAGLALVALASSGFLVGGRRTAVARRASRTAAEQDVLARTRAIARSRAAAVVHDTVLGDLAALAAIGAGPLPPAAAARVRSTLDLLASPGWADPAAPPDAVGGPVLAAIARAEDPDFSVRLDGELAALRGLDGAVEGALAAAIEQCLTNARIHAGVEGADVTVLADRDGLTVMVADAGAGFDPDAVDPDRLGLSTAVVARVEAVGGSVRVFARPGVGTTVLLAVPKAAGP
ncbi:sensor histidine kinase [Amnibacterium setariae]|uniref:Histidine kinase/HSP90-like ATPase domain-containing protein n=1 Tax=Amnibacterium setariae TaxID=2306585 RepID=A0A3A1TZG4_9MICO|nr:ATP-binding protein [Amnibacterium setariae]RIX30034.1 hypothetical protein D1781_00735 [Amnibacterium setariae]